MHTRLECFKSIQKLHLLCHQNFCSKKLDVPRKELLDVIVYSDTKAESDNDISVDSLALVELDD
jgi:hypothetical protein